MASFFGLPYFVWAGICLLLAIVWALFWPKARTAAAFGWRRVALRWFHTLTWLLLALAAVTVAIPALAATAVPGILAFTALPVYLLFLFAVVSR